MACQPSSSTAGSPLPPLSRPQLAEARRARAVELFEDGVSNAEIATAVGVCAESVRRWRRVWEEGGASALRRRAATGRPPKLDDSQAERVRAALEQGAQVHGFEADLWTLVRDGLSAHWSRAMRAWVAGQDWLTLERSPAYAPELNPVELLWSSLKKRELANLAGDHLADVADATERGIHGINRNPQLPWSLLAHTGLTTHPPHPPNLRKDR
ncbi:transposase [Streptomyces sp. NPDC002602]|uniref:transposase n=1 Tax=Streptomyces sp. NPDC002602 TaxID=3364654 RepID=UPI00369200D4